MRDVYDCALITEIMEYCGRLYGIETRTFPIFLSLSLLLRVNYKYKECIATQLQKYILPVEYINI